MTKKRGRETSTAPDERSPARRRADYVLGRMLGSGNLLSFVVLQGWDDSLLTHVFEKHGDHPEGEVPDYDQLIIRDLSELVRHTPPLSRAVVVCPGFFPRGVLSVPGVVTVENRNYWWDAPVVRWLEGGPGGQVLTEEQLLGTPTILQRPLGPPRVLYA